MPEGPKRARTCCSARFRRQGRLIPNVFSADGNHAYNSADASSGMSGPCSRCPRRCRIGRVWSVNGAGRSSRTSLNTMAAARFLFVAPDAEGFLSVGNPGTQLTWMDAVANGRPVTRATVSPWKSAPCGTTRWPSRTASPKRSANRSGGGRSSWTPCGPSFSSGIGHGRGGDYLADVWRDGGVETCVRPNQLFALSLPYPVLDEERYASVLSRVRRCLLTPYGLRTLGTERARLSSFCVKAAPAERDEAYHQGTVWPWLLGAYGEAVLRAAWDVPGSVRSCWGPYGPCSPSTSATRGSGPFRKF